MIKKITFVAFLCSALLSNLMAQENSANFAMRFAFRHTDTLRAALPINSINNTNAIIYNPVVNEIWASSSTNDTMVRFSVPRGQYLGAFTVARLTNGNTTRFMRAMTVKDNFFIWCVNNTDTIRKLDPRTGQEVQRIVVPKWMSTQNTITYDSISRGFWVHSSATNRLRLIDTTFTNVTDSLTIDASFGTGGIANAVFDGTDRANPVMWLVGWRHPEFPNIATSSSAATLIQVSLTTKLRTGIQKCLVDDFDFIININQAPRSACLARIPNVTNPVLIFKTGKFSGSVNLPTDLSGVTVGYELIKPYRPDASADSIKITPNYSMIPKPFVRPLTVSAKVRNVQAIQGAVGNVRFDVRNQAGSVTLTQSVPFNLNASMFNFYQGNTVVTPANLPQGRNSIVANIVQTGDPVFRNDTIRGFVEVTDTTLARDYADFIPMTPIVSNSSCFCFSATTIFNERPELGQAYQLDVDATLTSITARLAPFRTGDTTRFKVYTLDANRKPRYLTQTPLYLITPADSAAQKLTLPLPTPIRINAGQEFMVAITESAGNTSASIYATTQGYEAGKTFVYAAATLGGWQIVDTLTATGYRSRFQKALAIRPNFQIRSNNKEVNNVSNFTIAPNPTNGIVNLNIAMRQMEDVQIRVYNLSGQMILNTYLEKVDNIQKTIDLSSQSNGIYLISLITSKGIVTQKVIKE